jgi:hypothetical protein
MINDVEPKTQEVFMELMTNVINYLDNKIIDQVWHNKSLFF